MERIKRINITEMLSVFALIVTVVSLWLHTDNKLESFQLSMSQQVREIDQRNSDMIKDFHGRLCALEEKYHQMERK